MKGLNGGGAAFPAARPRAGLTETYGPPGRPPGDPAGVYTPPLERVPCPWPLVIAWAPERTTSKIAIHAALADSLDAVLAAVLREYGQDRIAALRLNHYGGSYNPRTSRRSSRMSLHAWGIAIDWDPARNRLRWDASRAFLAGPDYVAWWEIWEAEGWTSLGRSRDFDWMHVQAAAVGGAT